jgi:hypothetical protein
MPGVHGAGETHAPSRAVTEAETAGAGSSQSGQNGSKGEAMSGAAEARKIEAREKQRRRNFVKTCFGSVLYAAEQEGLIVSITATVDEIIADQDRANHYLSMGPDCLVNRLLKQLAERRCSICGVRRGSPHHDLCGLSDGEWPE